jgi:hypothetical protein
LNEAAGSCLARGIDATTAWQESPKFSFRLSNHVLTYISASPYSFIQVVVSPDFIAV